MDETYIFTCPECSRSVEAPLEAAGMEADCPECGESIVVPEPEAAEEVAGIEAEESDIEEAQSEIPEAEEEIAEEAEEEEAPTLAPSAASTQYAAPAVEEPEDDKSKTMRLELPDLDQIRTPVRRNITIKRNK